MTEFAKPVPDGESYEVQVRKSALKGRLLGLTPPPVEFGNYELECVVGKGASGVVFRARDRRLHRDVALKLLWARSGSRRTSSLDEARALATVSHPNVVAVYEAGQFQDCAFVAMEFVEGSSLRKWMEEPREADVKLGLLQQAAAGLAALHDSNIVHGDIKPENALVGSDGRLRLVDFGLSTGDTTAAGRTAGGVGTWTYMAPEVRAGAAPTVLSDQYALCRVGRELMFAGPSKTGSSALRAVLGRGLKDDPGNRFQCMEGLCHALESAPSQRRRIWFAAGAGATAIAVLALGLSSLRVEPPTCSGQLLLTNRPRVVLEQNLTASATSRWPLPGRDARLTTRASSFLALGQWDEGCAFIEQTLEDQGDLERLRCMQATYCDDRSSLPTRAKCFGGDVRSCESLAIVHEYEYLDAQRTGPQGKSPGVEFHRAMLLEATTEGCALGDLAMCELAKQTAADVDAPLEPESRP